MVKYACDLLNKTSDKPRKMGVTAIILNKSKILIIKRIWLPFIMHPGYWSFVTGGRDTKEKSIDAAYREILEETGIKRNQLTLLFKGAEITIRHHRKDLKWMDDLFIFRSSIRTVRLNPENTGYKWLSLKELQQHKNSTIDYIEQKKEVLSLVKKFMAKKG
jgi:8-oxo-dGTP pyrophosphatase MutT (NUDIX family)